MTRKSNAMVCDELSQEFGMDYVILEIDSKLFKGSVPTVKY